MGRVPRPGGQSGGTGAPGPGVKPGRPGEAGALGKRKTSFPEGMRQPEKHISHSFYQRNEFIQKQQRNWHSRRAQTAGNGAERGKGPRRSQGTGWPPAVVSALLAREGASLPLLHRRQRERAGFRSPRAVGPAEPAGGGGAVPRRAGCWKPRRRPGSSRALLRRSPKLLLKDEADGAKKSLFRAGSVRVDGLEGGRALPALRGSRACPAARWPCPGVGAGALQPRRVSPRGRCPRQLREPRRGACVASPRGPGEPGPGEGRGAPRRGWGCASFSEQKPPSLASLPGVRAQSPTPAVTRGRPPPGSCPLRVTSAPHVCFLQGRARWQPAFVPSPNPGQRGVASAQKIQRQDGS